MAHSRRAFLQQSAGAALGAIAAASLAARADELIEVAFGEVAPAPKKLDILMLGGTGFLGPQLVRYATARGHTVTLFNRGQRAPEMFPDHETIIGNRDPDIEPGLAPLEQAIADGRRWDAVLDTSAYVQRTARAGAEVLKDATDQYLFVSTICAYTDWATIVNGDEDNELATMEDETNEEVNAHYCELQAICEREFFKAFPDRWTVVRPGLIVGPGDFSDRFTYWPVRIERGGEVLVPGRYNDPIQWIDVRDLAKFIVTLAENKSMGAYHGCGPDHPADMAELVYTCKGVTGSDATFTWIDDMEFLAEHEVRAWQEAPLWADPNGELAGVNTYSNARSIAAGLTTRPLADTVRDTLVYWHSLPEDRRATLRAGISPEREAEVLAAWHAQQAS